MPPAGYQFICMRKSLQGCQGASYCAFAQFGIMCKWHAVYAYSVCTRCTTCVQVYATRAPVRLCASLFTAFRSTSSDRVKVILERRSCWHTRTFTHTNINMHIHCMCARTWKCTPTHIYLQPISWRWRRTSANMGRKPRTCL